MSIYRPWRLQTEPLEGAMKLCVHSAIYSLVLVPEGREGTIEDILGLDIQYNGQNPQVLRDDEICVPVDAKVELCKHQKHWSW